MLIPQFLAYLGGLNQMTLHEEFCFRRVICDWVVTRIKSVSLGWFRFCLLYHLQFRSICGVLVAVSLNHRYLYLHL